MRDQRSGIGTNKKNIVIGCAFVIVFFFGFYIGAITKTHQAKDIIQDPTRPPITKKEEDKKEKDEERSDSDHFIVFLPPEEDPPPPNNTVDLELLETTFIKTFEKPGKAFERWKTLKPEKWQYQAHESTFNIGHFFLEHWPNLYHFGGNLERFCGKGGMLDSVKALVKTMFPHVQLEDSDECDESNSPIYSCFMSWSCQNNRQHLLLSKTEMWEAFDALLKHCDVHTVSEEYDILLMNRVGTNNRRVLSYDTLLPYLNSSKRTYRHLDSARVQEMSQCELFREYAKARMVILPYGADLLYPLLLSKKMIALVHKITSEGFWDTSRHQLARFSPFKVLSVNGKTSRDISNSVGYYYYSSNVYHGNDLDLSTENMNDLLDIIDAMFKM